MVLQALEQTPEQPGRLIGQLISYPQPLCAFLEKMLILYIY